MFETMAELTAEIEKARAEFKTQAAKVALVRQAVEAGDALPRKLEIAELELNEVRRRMVELEHAEPNRIRDRCDDAELVRDRRRLKLEIGRLTDDVRRSANELQGETEKLARMEAEAAEHAAKDQPKRNPKLWAETLADIERQKERVADLRENAGPVEERLAAAYGELEAIEGRMRGEAPFPEPQPSDEPSAVFRSVEPVFAFRIAAGPSGKLRFFSTIDTHVTGKATIDRCRAYVPKFLVEV